MSPIILGPEAEAEFDEAFDWYEAQRPGLGIDFAAEVQMVLDRIAAMPKAFPKTYGDIRLALVNRFPYSIPYHIEKTHIVILAVFHGKRDPRVWQSRG